MRVFEKSASLLAILLGIVGNSNHTVGLGPSYFVSVKLSRIFSKLIFILKVLRLLLEPLAARASFRSINSTHLIFAKKPPGEVLRVHLRSMATQTMMDYPHHSLNRPLPTLAAVD